MRFLFHFHVVTAKNNDTIKKEFKENEFAHKYSQASSNGIDKEPFHIYINKGQRNQKNCGQQKPLEYM
jgi:hypothetical protein